MKYIINRIQTQKDNHAVLFDGTIRTYPSDVVKNDIIIYVEADAGRINKKQAFALFCLITLGNKSLSVPRIESDFITWEEIMRMAK